MLKTYAKPENHTTKKIYYYRDPLNDDFANNGIEEKPTKKNFKYVHKNPIYKLIEFIVYYIIAKPVVWAINKIVYKQKIVNHLKIKKKDIKGCFIYANHTSDMGDAFTPNLIFARRNNIIVNPAALSIPGIKILVQMLGAMPLPSMNVDLIHRYKDAIKLFVKKKQSITIYPEAHIWPFYTDIREFTSASFGYPVECNKPVICITNTYVPKGKKGFKLVSHVDGPFYPDILLDKNKAKEKLRNEVYETMIKRSKQSPQFEKFKYIDLTKIEEK